MDLIFELVEKIKAYGNSEFSDSIGERELNIPVPEPYFELLKIFNGGEIFIPGTVIYGIGEGSEFPYFEEANLKENVEKCQTPENYLIIGNVNYGDLICIDKEKPHRLYLWDMAKKEVSCQWQDFSELFAEEIELYELYLQEDDDE